jgi:penicillin amidase
MLRLNQAHDWATFTAALADWSAPAQNFVYADRAGNIGYHLAGHIPVRAAGQGLLPVPGWECGHDQLAIPVLAGAAGLGGYV